MIITYAISVVICLLITLSQLYTDGYIDPMNILFSFVPVYNTICAALLVLMLLGIFAFYIAAMINYGIYLIIKGWN